MKAYKELRAQFKEDVLAGNCYCILSGLKIENLKDLSLEHFVPLSRTEHALATQNQNIFPAHVVINHIKSSLLPCEWQLEKIKLLQKALKKNHLSKHERDIVEKAIQNSYTYNIYPCKLCVLVENCENAR